MIAAIVVILPAPVLIGGVCVSLLVLWELVLFVDFKCIIY